MRMILQRVKEAAVSVEGREISRIGPGILILVGVEKGDDEETARLAADKLTALRIFPDGEGRMNVGSEQAGAAFLIVSQFTLAASLARGLRPSFDRAERPEVAEPIVAALVRQVRRRGFTVMEGQFGAYMQVALVNDGPVTFVIDF